MKSAASLSSASPPNSVRWLPWLLLALAVVLAFMFSGSFKPDQAHFANDGPLGAQASRIYDMPGAFLGIWSDLYWVGSPAGNYTANFTGVLLWLLGPIGFNKFIVPSALLIVGVASGLFFRQLGFKSTVCVLGGLAAALNSNFVSNACWGLPSRALCLGAMFLALAAAESSLAGKPLARIIKLVLAGLGIGLSVSEGGDNGAIFSLFFAAYVVWITWHHNAATEGAIKRLTKAGAKLCVIVVFAFLLAAQIVDLFFGITGVGVGGLGQKGMTSEQKWFAATQWSLPKMETLRVVVPGLYGYRLDTPNGGNYWGGVGRDAAYDTTKQGFPRHSGAGEYAGVLVVVVALWALCHSFIGGGAFTDKERRMVWFWGTAALIAMLLSWGRHAPFYQFVYALPYFSTVRNPMKFMHPFHLALMILFAYGLQGLWRRFVEKKTGSLQKASAFDRKWLLGSGVAVGLSIVGWLIYASARTGLTTHIASLEFEEQMASQMAKFSIREVGWSAFFLVASCGVVLMFMKGAFTGDRAKWAGWVVGIVLVIDLARANSPWIQYYNYKEKYSSNGVLEILANNPYEHRVVMPPLQGDRNFSFFQQVYSLEWLQHQFPFFNIQSLDQPQEPRMPPEKQAYREALGANLTRLWELTNTRFVGGMAGPFIQALNQQLDPLKQRFTLHTRFTFFQNPANGTIGARVDESGPFALVEFTGALPRAKLFTKWEVITNAQAVLTRLADPAFDPHQTVLLSEPVQSRPSTDSAAVDGTVAFLHYAPKRIELRTDAPGPSLLLLNDKFDPAWKATVDGQSTEVLRANFLMRGVEIPAGKHTVVVRYEPRSITLTMSATATSLGVGLCLLLVVLHWRERSALSLSAAVPSRSG
jgi:hypothetical protein